MPRARGPRSPYLQAAPCLGLTAGIVAGSGGPAHALVSPRMLTPRSHTRRFGVPVHLLIRSRCLAPPFIHSQLLDSAATQSPSLPRSFRLCLPDTDLPTHSAAPHCPTASSSPLRSTRDSYDRD